MPSPASPRGIIQSPVDHSLDGHGIDLIQNAQFFKKAFEAGAAVVEWLFLLSTHINTCSFFH
jgi:hypothetical protein